jgi:hypothetical protein
MRAVIIGTDFMRDTDGSFKALETNTNIQLDTQWCLNFDSSSFELFVQSNNFSEIVLISNENQLSSQAAFSLNYDLEQIHEITKTQNLLDIDNPFSVFTSFKSYLDSFTSGSNITFNTFKTDTTSITIPFVEDTDDKLIIRLSYDTTALIDDTYARDNWEFLKLMYDADSNSIPKSYINDNELSIDNIGETLRDNGNHPNYCIKKRVTPSDNKIYPKLYKISTLEELETLKSNLEVDEYIQEFIYNTDDLLDNRVKSYRSIDMLYGSNLDIINLQILEKTTNLEIVDNADFDDNGQVQYWDKMRYCQKFYTSINEIAIKLDATGETKVILPNGDISLAKNLNTGDSVKSILFSTLPLDENIFESATQWSSSFNETITNFDISTTQLVNNNSLDYFGVLVTIETDTNSIFSDVIHGFIMVKDGDNATFKEYGSLTIGETIVLFDSITNTLISSVITNISYKFDKFIGYSLDFEQSDLFLTLEETENQQRYGIVTHNYDYDCRITECIGTQNNTVFTYYRCGDNVRFSYYGNNGGAFTGSPAYLNPGQVCARYTGTWPTGPYCQNSDEGSYSNYVWYGAYCNDQKSDIHYKENLILIGKSNSGLNIYQFNYKNEDGLYEGVIAQELIGTKYQEALSKNEDDLYVVDYNKIDVEFKKIK